MSDKTEFDTACDLFLRTFFPSMYASWPRPNPATFSVLAYHGVDNICDRLFEGFGHSELANVSDSDFKVIAGATFQDRFGRP